MRYRRYSAAVISSSRWRALRQLAKRRDGWKCVSCGAHGRLEVDHILPVRLRPDLAYSLDNLQTLCPRCHARKTRYEVHGGEPSAGVQAWRELMKLPPPPIERKQDA